MRVVSEWVIAALGLLVLAPLFALVAVAIVAETGRPVLFRQTRVGRRGVTFQIVKFRTMCGGSGRRITAGRDERITQVGRLLRRYKIDELPQLWNVLKREMSLIGPRPEIPAFVDLEDRNWRAVLEVRPGLTDVATLLYRDEEELLARAEDPEEHYRRVVLPEKLELNLAHLRGGSLRRDLRLLLLTVRYSLFPAGFDARRVKEMFVCKESA